MGDPDRELAWLRRARELSHRLVDEPDASRLLPLILDSAIALAGAERGFLVRVQPERGSLRVDVARGFDGESLQGGTGAVSRRVVEEVLQRGAGVVTTRDEDRALLQGTTIQERKVLAILCVPMRLRGQTLGVIYLDHRFRPDAFHPGDVEPLRLFADQAALAIESAELRARRERAEAQLELARDQLRAQETLEQRRHRLVEAHRSRREGAPAALGALVGESPAARVLFLAIERAARSRDPVLIVGETGSGKSAVAAELHRGSGLPGELVSVHCARLAAEQLEGELRRASGGTLLLEELRDASPALQAALVVLLAQQRQAPSPSQALPARIVATTRIEPLELVRSGVLREDLSYRLDVLRLDVPPLRDRSEDLPALIAHFARAAAEGAGALDLTPSALQLLCDYAWPGNLHELENVVRRLLTLDKKVTSNDLPATIREAAPPPPSDDARTIAAMEQRMVVEALQACGGNKAEAARRLGIQRSTLYRLLDRFGLR